MKISTWNINSVRLRLSSLAQIIKDICPDVICLQEIKVKNELFPSKELSVLGYPYQAVAGMKSYNGVAILSRLPLTKINVRDWCKKADCRHISAVIQDTNFSPIELHNFYIPAGGDIPNPIENEKFAHKLAFLKEVTEWQKSRTKKTKNMVLVGDLNIAPLPSDVWSHKQLLKVVSHTPIETEALNQLQISGPWIDAVRKIIPPQKDLFTWWSYRSKDWTKNNRGRRLDHIWVSESLKHNVSDANVYQDTRSWERPSDHVPVTITLSQ